MGLALGRLAVVLGRGRAGYNAGQAVGEQQQFENDRTLAREGLGPPNVTPTLDTRGFLRPPFSDPTVN